MTKKIFVIVQHHHIILLKIYLRKRYKIKSDCILRYEYFAKLYIFFYCGLEIVRQETQINKHVVEIVGI